MRIYNLVPTVAGMIDDWEKYLDEIYNMGFNYIYINPIFEVGYSRSLYAPKNFYNLNQNIIDQFSNVSPYEQLRSFINKAHNKGIKVIIELIMTHTSIDSEILISNPNWYKYDEGGNLRNFSFFENNKQIKLDDLIEIDNENSVDKNNLWNYWIELMEYYLTFGFDGFKIEAAYKLPNELLKIIIEKGKTIKKDTVFIGDNLGAGFHEMFELTEVGFDYLFTSFKWWDFRETWFLEQHYRLKNIVKLISFPENYNTERLAEKYNKNINAQKAWYTIAALLNTGVSIPIGYEYCCDKRIEMLSTFDFESYDYNEKGIKDYIKLINTIKSEHKIFHKETDIYIIDTGNENIFLLKKMNSNKDEEAFLILNKNYNSIEKIELKHFKNLVTLKSIKNILTSENIDLEEISNSILEFQPGEIKIFLVTN
ncbi:MAG: hypothetical protein GX287_07180 [Fusobacteria bacterium]|nr:hypothetical protein [Fusobacteriota bacterium]